MGILYICFSGVGSIRCFIDVAVESRPPSLMVANLMAKAIFGVALSILEKSMGM